MSVVVTGASGAIGSAVVQRLVADGHNVIAVSHSRVGANAPAVAWHSVDIADEQSVTAFFDELDASGISITGLVNSAGINLRSAAVDCTAEMFMKNVGVNLLGTFLMSREAGRRMITAGGGSVVNVSSTVATVGSPRSQASYSATKGGVNALTVALAVEWAPFNVRVNAVAPTFTDTPMNAPVLADAALSSQVLESIPLGRYGEPDDIANAVAWLLDPRTSFVTGDVLRVDGGYLAV